MIIGDIKFSSTVSDFTISIYFFSRSTVFNNIINDIFNHLATIISNIIGKDVTIKLIRVQSLSFSKITATLINNYINVTRRNKVLKTLAKKFGPLMTQSLTNSNSDSDFSCSFIYTYTPKCHSVLLGGD